MLVVAVWHYWGMVESCPLTARSKTNGGHRTFGAGLGPREIQRRGLGMAQIPNKSMAAGLNWVRREDARNMMAGERIVD